jgi:hypothetical protein
MLDPDPYPDPELWSKVVLKWLTVWLLVLEALLLIGLTQISFLKTGFDHPFVMESLLWVIGLEAPQVGRSYVM